MSSSQMIRISKLKVPPKPPWLRPTSFSGPESEGSDQEGEKVNFVKSQISLPCECVYTQGNFDHFSQPGVVYGESVARMARGDKRRSWGENHSGAVLTFGDKQVGSQEHRLLVEKEDLVVGKKDKKTEDSIQLRKDVEELRRRKQELREQFGENEKVLTEVERELAAVGRQGEVARFGVHITFNTFQLLSRSQHGVAPQVQRGGR